MADGNTQSVNVDKLILESCDKSRMGDMKSP